MEQETYCRRGPESYQKDQHSTCSWIQRCGRCCLGDHKQRLAANATCVRIVARGVRVEKSLPGSVAMRAAPLTEPANKTEVAARKEMMRAEKNNVELSSEESWSARSSGCGLVVVSCATNADIYILFSSRLWT